MLKIQNKQQDDTNGYTIMRSLKEMLKNRNFVFLFLTMNFVNGIYSALPAMISKLTEPFGDPALGGPFAIVFLLTGVILSFAIGPILDKFRCYKLLNMICCFVTLFMSFFILFVFHIKSSVAMLISLAIYGGFIIPMGGIVTPFAVELCWPVPESHNNGLIGVLNLAWGTVMSLLGAYMELQTAFIFFGVQAFIACVCSVLLKEDLRRLKLQAV